MDPTLQKLYPSADIPSIGSLCPLVSVGAFPSVHVQPVVDARVAPAAHKAVVALVGQAFLALAEPGQSTGPAPEALRTLAVCPIHHVMVRRAAVGACGTLSLLVCLSPPPPQVFGDKASPTVLYVDVLSYDYVAMATCVGRLPVVPLIALTPYPCVSLCPRFLCSKLPAKSVVGPFGPGVWRFLLVLPTAEATRALFDTVVRWADRQPVCTLSHPFRAMLWGVASLTG